MSATSRLALLLTVLLVAFSVGCGGQSSSGGQGGNGSSASNGAPAAQGGQCKRFPKTRFALHAGLAFGAFHRYIYKPYRSGAFSRPQGRKKALAKAALAAGFAYHETKVALRTAQCSRALARLVSPLTALQGRLSGTQSGLKQGRYDPRQITATNGDVAALHSESARAGEPIRERAPALGP